MWAGRDGAGEEGRPARVREPSRPLSTRFRIQKKKKKHKNTKNKPILLTGGADQVLHQNLCIDLKGKRFTMCFLGKYNM